MRARKLFVGTPSGLVVPVVRDADQIVVMERGEVSEVGSHQELLRNPAGIYTHLYTLQQGTGAL